MTVLAIDPGTSKCGLALLQDERVVIHEVVPLATLSATVEAWLRQYHPQVVVVGDGTAMKQVRSLLVPLGVGSQYRLELVPEHHTTERARQRYFAAHPPRGWRRWLPAGMRVPEEPYDDYAAILLAEDFLASRVKS